MSILPATFKEQFNYIFTRDKNLRERNIEKLKYKLSLVSRWQARLANLSDPLWESTVVQRIDRAVDLVEQQGITYVGKRYDNGTFDATYHKGDVKIALSGRLWIDAKGKVSVEVSRKMDHSRVLLITVGKIERITNEVLKTLLKPAVEEVPF